MFVLYFTFFLTRFYYGLFLYMTFSMKIMLCVPCSVLKRFDCERFIVQDGCIYSNERISFQSTHTNAGFDVP